MTKTKPSQNLEVETLINLHAIKRSAGALSEDLRYFHKMPGQLSDSQIINLLGDIEEVEDYIKMIRRNLVSKMTPVNS